MIRFGGSFGVVVAVALLAGACSSDDDEGADGGVGGAGAGGEVAGGTGGTGAGGETAGGAGGEAGGAGGESGPPADPVFAISWNGDNLVLDITTSAANGPYRFGIAETGADNGWMGEDCLEGAFGGVDVCHTVPVDGHLELMHMDAVDDVADGMTLFKADMAPGLTYYVERNSLDFQGCWTWGEDTSIYEDVGCDVVTP
jgi:hypothetical protein